MTTPIGELLPPGESWWDRGLCSQTDPEAYYPEKGASPRDAKRICARCPVADRCLEDALDRKEPHGVWGGKTERERRALLKLRVAGGEAA